MTEHATRTARRLAHALGRKAKDEDPYEIHADALKALAHPKRLLVLDLLSDGKERNVSELQDATDISQSNLSQNLAVMRNAGLLLARREGNVVWYRLADARVAKAVDLVRAVLETRNGDPEFASERRAAKAKEQTRRSATLSVVVLAGLAAAVLFGAALHPVFAGGAMADVPDHMAVMMTSPDAGTLWDVCMNVMTEPLARVEPAAA